MFENLVEKLKKNPTSLVFTEGPDPRILEAASRLKKCPPAWGMWI